jgi:hypothetical protein
MKDYEIFTKLASLHFQNRNVMVPFCVCINCAFLNVDFKIIHWLGTLKFNKLPMSLSSKYLASSRLGFKVFGLQGHSFGIIKFETKSWLGCSHF